MNNGFIEAFEESGTEETSASVLSDDVPTTATPMEALVAFGEREELARAIEKLPKREQLLLALHYQ